MANTEQSIQIKRLTEQNQEYMDALHKVFDLPATQLHSPPHPHIAQLLDKPSSEKIHSSNRHALNLYGAYDDQELISVSLAIESPGSSAMVFIPANQNSGIVQKGTILALNTLLAEAWNRGLTLLEMLLLPGSSETAQMVEQAGFRFITRLLYLRRRDGVNKSPSGVSSDLKWVEYTPDSEPVFQSTLEQTYAQSLDCPELMGLRTINEIMAGHRAVGEYDPSLWWVVMRSGKPVGVMLLNKIPIRSALEIVYMGVVRAARGTGVADALIRRAVQAVGNSNTGEIALAVDRRNDPARKMYARWGFIEFGARDAWIASPPVARV